MNILITGANSGLGFETSRQLLAADYSVIIACRSSQKARKTSRKLTAGSKSGQVIEMVMDLSKPDEIRRAVEQLEVPVHVLICNAGMSYEGPHKLTDEGVEETFAVNHLGHFLLTCLLMKKFPDTLDRISIVSSEVHRGETGPFPEPRFQDVREIAFPTHSEKTITRKESSRRYVHSKLCNLWFTFELNRRLPYVGRGNVKVNAFNPGFMPRTGLSRDASGFTRFMMRHILPRMKFLIPDIRTVKESAHDLIEISLVHQDSNQYFDGQKPVFASELAYNRDRALELWNLSEEIIGNRSECSLLP